MNSDFLRLNTAFKLPKDIAERAIALSREISRNNEVPFVLDGIQFHPHITIYSPEYPERDINKVLEIVGKLARNIEKVSLVSKKISGGEGLIGIEFNHTPGIQRIHEEMVRKLNPLREEHIMEKYKADDCRMKFTSEQLENIRQYGYPNSMGLYHPHLAISRLKNESLAETMLENLKWDILEFIVSELAVYKMGEHGTCREIVKTFSLR